MDRKKTFSLLIPTKNRKEDILYTLDKSLPILQDPRVECVVIDNGTDGTAEDIRVKYPSIRCIHEPNELGIFHLRNRLMSEANGEYLLFIDDDVNFLVDNVLEIIIQKFIDYPEVGIVAFRIYWDLQLPKSFDSSEPNTLVKSFGAGACCIHKNSIAIIPPLPVWFNFYGEEDFMSINLFKRNVLVLYSPEILVHHRVDLKLRRRNVNNYQERYRKAFRAGLYNVIIFYPVLSVFYYFLYYSKHQLIKIFKEDSGTLLIKPVLLAYADVMKNLLKLLRERNPLSKTEYNKYRKLAESKLYWKPESDKIQ